jgi:hypothetical protein
MHNRVIARALFIAACVSLASWASAATQYVHKTDLELTELAAGWDALSEEQRRALLTEVKARMHVNAGKRPVLTIKTERRYGRVVRQPDGSLVRIETTEHVIRYQALPEDASDHPFGVGFEERSVAAGAPAADTARAASEAPAASKQPPAIHVGNANQH